MSFDENEFIRFLIREGCIGFFEEPIVLTSGQESFWYVNLRVLQDSFSKLDSFTDFIVRFVKSQNIASPLVGIPESATLPAIKANERLGYQNYLYLRQSLRSHGILGRFPYSLSPTDISGKEFTLLEDTLTTGDSVIKTALNLIEGGVQLDDINNIVVVCYRENKRWGGRFPHEYIQKHLGIPVYCMSKAINILPEAINQLRPDRRIIEALKEEYSYHQQILDRLPYREV